LFIYGEEEPQSEKEVVKDEENNTEHLSLDLDPAEQEKLVFDQIVESKFAKLDWNEVSEISWEPAVLRDTGAFVYAVTVSSGKRALVKLVIKDKAKSTRFLSHVNKIFIKVLYEREANSKRD
jgi:hypothetical protein